MKVETKILPKSLVEFIIEETAENVAKYRKTVIKEAGKNMNIKGFRKGASIPDNVIIQQLGEEALTQMTIEKAIDGVYRDTLRKEKLMPVAQAEILEVMSQDPLKVKIQVEVFPKVEVKDTYKKVKLTQTTLEVSDDEVGAALDDIQTRFTRFDDVRDDYTAQMGDIVTIDTQGYDLKGKELASTNMNDYPLVLGSNMLVPGFEEDMVGMKMGEERELDVAFPKDYYDENFAGKKTKFTVTAKKIEHAHKPEFTEEFIEQLRGKKLNLDGFKALIKEELMDTKESNDAMQREMQLIDELLKHTNFEIGDTLLSKQTEQVFAEIKENIQKDGVKVADYLASLGLSEEEYKKQHVEETAKKRLQGELILNELMTKENIEVSDEDMKAEVEKIMSRFESEDVLKRLQELYVPGNRYYEELKRRIAFKRLIDSFFTA